MLKHNGITSKLLFNFLIVFLIIFLAPHNFKVFVKSPFNITVSFLVLIWGGIEWFGVLYYSPVAKKTEKKARVIDKLISLTTVCVLTISFHETPHNIILLKLLGIGFLVLGVTVRFMSIKTLGVNFVASLAPIGYRINRGIYRYLYHPAYLGFLTILMGICMFFESMLGSLITVALMIPLVLIRIFYEEKSIY